MSLSRDVPGRPAFRSFEDVSTCQCWSTCYGTVSSFNLMGECMAYANLGFRVGILHFDLGQV